MPAGTFGRSLNEQALKTTITAAQVNGIERSHSDSLQSHKLPLNDHTLYQTFENNMFEKSNNPML